ncbi:MAG TPA: phage tail protein [Acidimicrobiales bacterium]|jgi:phage tail-like protein
MPFSNYDGAVSYSFGLTVDGITTQAITEVDGLNFEVDVIEVKQQTPDGKYVVKKIPGRKKTGELTFTRIFQQDDNWSNWIKKIFTGDVSDSRKNGSVDVYDYGGVKVTSFTFTNGWPSKIEYSGMKAGGTDPTTEKLTLTHEGLEPQ